MWAKLKASSKIAKGKEVIRQVRKSFNPNEEYLSAFRTKSYADFYNKVKLLVNEPSSSFSYSHDHKFSEVLLEPDEEAIPGILESAILSKVPELKGLMLNYCDISAEASKICSHLLKSINRIQSNYHVVQQALDKFEDYSPNKIKYIVSELNLFILQGLWSHILNRKYLKNQSILNFNKSAHINYSNTWKGILFGAQILPKGLKWRFGNGDDILFWKDNWVGCGLL